MKRKGNFAVVPKLFSIKFSVAVKMLRSFLKFFREKLGKRHFEGYDHMKNFGLI